MTQSSLTAEEASRARISAGIAAAWLRRSPTDKDMCSGIADLITRQAEEIERLRRLLQTAESHLIAAAGWTDENMNNPIMAIASRNCARLGVAALQENINDE